jgi:hypothetical protein
MRLRQLSLLPVFLLILSACSTLGLEKAQGFTDRLAYANGQVTAVANSATTALSSGRISVEDAKFVSATAKEAGALLDAAQGANEAGDPKSAQGRLLLALNVLDQLSTYLASKEK